QGALNRIVASTMQAFATYCIAHGMKWNLFHDEALQYIQAQSLAFLKTQTLTDTLSDAATAMLLKDADALVREAMATAIATARQLAARTPGGMTGPLPEAVAS
ncbi:MAG: hypothetical protein INR62_08515, partial [Rhodospirillales bacterium]|nr:hypothetical protein [Acetobacter sp.]